jgi:DNA (cytosine-5)-methyltransferase 1
MASYYNEIDSFAAAWLRELIKAGHIADGEVDERSIEVIRPDDLRGFTQCHFFAGIGGWSYALRLAGWPDDRAVWTGSCPCQPFSQAGRGDGEDDARHLWPVWFRLIRECAPPVVFGEQVASADGHVWLARVHRDLESQAFAVGAADLCAAGVTAPHKRQRYFFVADATSEGRQRLPAEERTALADGAGASEALGGMADTHRCLDHWWSGAQQVGWNAIEGEVARGGRKYRAQWRIKPGLSLLAYGIPRRMERCRGFGNAIVPQVAQIFIEAYCDARGF